MTKTDHIKRHCTPKIGAAGSTNKQTNTHNVLIYTIGKNHIGHTVC